MAQGDSEKSLMSITAWNALTALGVGLTAVIPILLLLIFAQIFFDLADGRDVEFGELLGFIPSVSVGLGMCVTPIVFILTFALLQRFRIR